MQLILNVFLALIIYSAQIQAATSDEPISPIQKNEKLDSALVKFGEKLYNSKLFSRDQNLSCQSCHSLSLHSSKQSKSVRIPTLYNIIFNKRYFSNGRAKSIDEVIDDHVTDKNVFNNQWDEVVARFNQQVESGEGTTYQATTLRSALNEYLHSLVTPSAFDRYLLGDKNAISKNAINGYEIFKSLGCDTCHQGVNLGGNLFQKMEIYQDYFAKKPKPTVLDFGRFNVTGLEKDKFVYRVPGLRNIALTAPYFHDSSANTLEEALDIMGKPKLGKDIPKRDYDELIAFLESLSGDELLAIRD